MGLAYGIAKLSKFRQTWWGAVKTNNSEYA